MAVESGGGISAHATDFKISFNRYTTRGNRRYGNPGKEGEGERERRERDEQHTNPGPWLNCPHQPRNWVGARENRLQIERTSSRWINRVSTPPTSLSTSSWFCLLLPSPSPFPLPRHGRFHRCKIEAGLDRRPRMERGRLVEIVDRRFQAFTGSPGWLAPGYLETRPRKERFRVITPAPTSSRSNSAVLPRLSTQIGRVFCPSTGSTIPMIAPPISVIGPKFFPLGRGGREEGTVTPPSEQKVISFLLSFSNLFFFIFFQHKRDVYN